MYLDIVNELQELQVSESDKCLVGCEEEGREGVKEE